MFSLYFKVYIITVLVVVFITTVEGEIINRNPKTVRGALRAIGLGPWCVGCPAHYCDDDPNIVLGYCCGCAGFLDNLPVTCVPALRCPLNIHELCLRYEYMMHCCC